MKIVTIGGGTGQFTLLSAIKNIEEIDITAIVSMVDSGGSTGKLRDEFGVLPPGDALKCLIALSPLQDARKILQARFQYNQKLKNHNAGNLLLTFLSQYLANDFSAAIEALGEILQIKGSVLPVTLDKSTLAVELENGKFVFGESEIDLHNDSVENRIKKVFLVPHQGQAKVFHRAYEEILNADHILIGPGDLYTSLIPNLLVEGISEALKKTNASIIYISNIMTKYTETANFKLSSFVNSLETYMQRNVDIVICNEAMPAQEILQEYEKEKAWPVKIDLFDDRIYKFDLLSQGELARHDPEKLKEAIKLVLNS